VEHFERKLMMNVVAINRVLVVSRSDRQGYEADQSPHKAWGFTRLELKQLKP
jgi:hypothetical protein